MSLVNFWGNAFPKTSRTVQKCSTLLDQPVESVQSLSERLERRGSQLIIEALLIMMIALPREDRNYCPRLKAAAKTMALKGFTIVTKGVSEWLAAMTGGPESAGLISSNT